MPSMISGLLFYFLLLLRSAQVLGRIISTVATDNCTQSKGLGGSVSCCTGTCSDGTVIGEPGLCMDWNTPCTDEVGATCPSGQVMKYGPSSSFVDSGDGDCYGDGFCQWEQTLWTWSCCDCPPGYTSVSDGECGTDAGSFVCLACSDPAETLTDDGTGWVCTVTKGISCDIVDNLVDQFDIISANAPETTGYYRHVLNLACLRSNCPNPACDIARQYANPDPECANLEGDFSFEQSVLSRFAQPLSQAELSALSSGIGRTADSLSILLQAAERELVAMGPSGAVVGNALRKSCQGDARTIGAELAGAQHFTNQLEPGFRLFVRKQVDAATSTADLYNRITALKSEHGRLFKCGVVPGLEAEGEVGDLPRSSAQIAKILVPSTASVHRDNIVAGTTFGRIPLHDAARDDDPNITMWKSLRCNIRNWESTFVKGFDQVERNGQQERAPGNAIDDFPGITTVKTDLTGSTSHTINLNLLTSFSLDIESRDADLIPLVARATLMYPNQTVPQSVVDLNIGNHQVSVVGPIATITDPSVEVIMMNDTYALGKDFHHPHVSYADIVAAGQRPTIPIIGDTALLYRHATLSLSYDPTYLSSYGQPVNVATDITIFDLINGQPLQGVTFTGTANRLVFQAALYFGNGIWSGSLRGGGQFALGLVNRSLKSTTKSSTAKFSTLSRTSLSSSSFHRLTTTPMYITIPLSSSNSKYRSTLTPTPPTRDPWVPPRRSTTPTSKGLSTFTPCTSQFSNTEALHRGAKLGDWEDGPISIKGPVSDNGYLLTPESANKLVPPAHRWDQIPMLEITPPKTITSPDAKRTYSNPVSSSFPPIRPSGPPVMQPDSTKTRPVALSALLPAETSSRRPQPWARPSTQSQLNSAIPPLPSIYHGSAGKAVPDLPQILFSRVALFVVFVLLVC